MPSKQPTKKKTERRGKVKAVPLETVECWALVAKDESIVSVSDSELQIEAEQRDNYMPGEVRRIHGTFIPDRD